MPGKLLTERVMTESHDQPQEDLNLNSSHFSRLSKYKNLPPMGPSAVISSFQKRLVPTHSLVVLGEDFPSPLPFFGLHDQAQAPSHHNQPQEDNPPKWKISRLNDFKQVPNEFYHLLPPAVVLSKKKNRIKKIEILTSIVFLLGINFSQFGIIIKEAPWTLKIIGIFMMIVNLFLVLIFIGRISYLSKSCEEIGNYGHDNKND